ncbi:hypothetical protein KIPB_015959, partial [Kipferlia bialata]|eukprot:g15959.t1
MWPVQVILEGHRVQGTCVDGTDEATGQSASPPPSVDAFWHYPCPWGGPVPML